ncbi:MAG: ABC transporter substrate-binding protein [Saprospiraceae bacterium]|nr:ABC transporter substrate-binding protein [Saprospiraceae bacterium]
MISVPNHLPPLNGNKMNLLYVFVILFFIACSPKTIPATITANPTQIVKTIKDTVKQDVLLPIDTIIWNDVSGSVSPITVPVVKEIKKPKIVGKSGKTEWKESYQLKLFIPLNSDHYQVSNLVNNRFVQYYAGILLALEDLENQGATMNLEVVDTEMGAFQASQAINEIPAGSVDVIIGPFEREDLKTMASVALEKKITLISPWQTSTKIATQNEYYIQLKPNLKDHFKKIVEHAVANHGYENIAVITHQNQDGNAWFSFMNDVAKNLMGPQYSLKHIAVSKDSLISPNTAFVNLFNNNLF